MSASADGAEYYEDREWSDQYLPRMRELIGAYLLQPSDFQTDVTAATDLVLLKAGNLDVACRIRRPGYQERYGWQFTIRADRESGATTEYDKIANGFADWLFYGHADEDGKRVARWFLIDLKAFRAHLILHSSQIKMGTGINNDGTKFRWFDVRSFPKSPQLMIASSVEIEPLPKQEDPTLDPELEKILK